MHDPDLLLRRFGLSGFRPGQREAVEAALQGRDSLVVMPTGGGKSLCYQLPALAGEGLVVVVSPLIALMADQLRRLAGSGVSAVMLASGMPDDHNAQALRAIREGRAALVLVAPERFVSRALMDALAARRLSLFVVDEAHCVAQWGHDFRPDYLQLDAVIEQLGRPPVMAATATATPRVAREVIARLRLRDPLVVRRGFDRPNLTFDVVTLDGKGTVARKQAALEHRLGGPDGLPAIVYCGTRADTDALARRLAARFSVVAYHAGMDGEARRAAQEAFMSGEADVVVATNAFGMGVDKADVRTVAHWALPTSLEAYYQEAGRAGRDGRPAHALLLASRMDLGRLIRFNQQAPAGIARDRGWEAYRAIERFTSSDRCRRRQLLDHFGDDTPCAPTVRCCDACEPDAGLTAVVAAPVAARPRIGARPHGRGAPTVALGDTYPDAMRRLAAWRLRRAAGKPAYTVATNATLAEVLRLRPRDEDALLGIRGIGPAFCARHGPSLLEELASLDAALRPSSPAAAAAAPAGSHI